MKKESKLIPYLEWITLFILILGIILLTNKLDFARNLKPDTTIGKYAMVIGIFLSSFVVLGFHELGHLITGMIQGFKFELFVVGPLGIKRENDRIKFYLNKNLGYYGGIAATIPKDDHPDNAKKFANVLLGGPVASIVFAIICFLISYFIGKPLGIIFYTGGTISIAIFFATTIPSKTGMFFTDRKRYQRLTKPGKDQEVELAILRILGNYSKDNSYKNISKNDIDILVSDDIPFIHFFGLSSLICYQLEKNKIIETQVLEDYREASKNMSKNIVKAFDKEIEKYKEKILN
ncbi:M50 family metallopeptidase [uncultured Aquimarina sp.]|uniref:M50 family metallopeptidase n=1 Tax=uncultured Aquimarina sp. TaxID=575652 RepID=UPI00262AE248|nr:M50 family metallopeptidase [uncultured Aquimarina sp.]